MRIGIFTDTYLPEINGVVSSSVTLCKQLEAHGHEVYVITTKVGLGKCEWKGNILRLAGVELKFLYGYSMTGPLHINAFKEVKKLDLDLIHVQTEFGVGIFARICANRLNIPLVSTYHTTYEDYTHYINFMHLDTVDKAAKSIVAKLSKLYGDSSCEVIAPSEKTRQMLLKYGVKRDIYVVPTGLDLKRFDPSNTTNDTIKKLRKEYGIREDEKLIVFVGRIAQEKSIDMVIKAFEIVKKQTSKIKLLIIGGGPDAHNLEALASELSLDDIVIFGGKKPSDTIPSYYHMADAFVSASTTETQGMTYIEALASGLMIFARHDEAIGNLIDEGITGYYFDNEMELADCILKWNNITKEELKDNALKCINKTLDYDQEIFYQRIIKVYNNALDKYEQMWAIERIKTKNDYVLLDLIKKDEDLKLITSYDTYFNLGLRKGQKLTDEQLSLLKKEQVYMNGYLGCVKMIARKDRTTKEIYDYLTTKTDCDIETINKIVQTLEDKGLINDYAYAQNAIYNMKMTLHGEKEIIRSLKRKGIDFETIDELLSNRDVNEEIENATKLAMKLRTTINGKSLKMTRKLLYQKLLAKGYSNEVVSKVLDDMNFNEEADSEIENLKTCAYKVRKKYEKTNKKASEIRNSIFKYCASQGYDYEDIYAVLDEMEWDD